MTKDFSGVFTALITPFKTGDIDWPSLRRLLKAQLDGGVSGLVVNGTTGESPTLSADEKHKLFNFVRSEIGGQVPIIMGTGSNSTSDTIDATKAAASWGADAALVVVPYYNKPPQRGLFQHFQKVAECSKMPILLYNVPSRTMTRLDLDTIQELSHIANIVGIKEATGNLEFGRSVVENCREDFLVTSGDDGTFIDLIAQGSKGVISVASNIMPKQMSAWCALARKGDRSARTDFSRYEDFNNALYVEANPIPVKMAAHLMGLIDSPELRLPLVKLSEPLTFELKTKMMAVGLL